MAQNFSEQITNLQGQIDELKRQMQSLQTPQQAYAPAVFKDIDFYQDLKVDNLIIKHISQSSEPVLLKNQIVLWTDTDDNKTYIVANLNGVTNHIELV